MELVKLCVATTARRVARVLKSTLSVFPLLIVSRRLMAHAPPPAGRTATALAPNQGVRSSPSTPLCSRVPPLLQRYNVSSVHVGLLGEPHAATVGQWRYFTAFNCEEALCLAFMNRAKREEWVGSLVSHDGGRSFGSRDAPPTLVLPAHWELEPGRRLDWMTANLAIMRSENSGAFMLFGGLSQADVRTPGVVFAQGRSHRFSAHGLAPTPLPGAGGAPYHAQPSQWRAVRTLFDGRHPGCVEGRRADHDVGLSKLLNATPDGRLACEFDGRLSAVEFSGRTWLYARANPALSGQRFVQVTSSADLHEWAPFELLRVDGYRMEDGDIYFLAVQRNPVAPALAPVSLVGLAPLVHRGEGCIGLTASIDGVRWSTPVPLLRCGTDHGDPFHPGHRATHQPAAGMLQRGDRVLIFVHEFVSGIVQHRQGHGGQKPARLRRFAVPVDVFAAWTRDAVRSLRTRPSLGVK